MGSSQMRYGTVVLSRVDLSRAIAGNVYTCQLKTKKSVDEFNDNFNKILKEVNDDIDSDGVRNRCKDVITSSSDGEDDVHIIASTPLFSLQEGYEEVMLVDGYFIRHVNWARSKGVGHLTSSIKDMGTGVRFTVRLNLINMFRANKIEAARKTVTNMGLSFTESYPEVGDPSNPAGCFFDITLSCGMRTSIFQIIDDLEGICNELDEMEAQLMKALMKHNSDTVKNSIFRAYSVCKNSLLISASEAVDIVSDMRVAIMLGALEGIDYKGIYDLLRRVHQDCLQNGYSEDDSLVLDEKNQINNFVADKLRARIINRAFKSIKLLIGVNFDDEDDTKA